MTVVPYRDQPPRDWIALMPAAVELAKAVSNTEFVPRGLRGNAAAVTAAVLYGDEVGLGPMQALAKIAVIDGRPTLAAEAQRALILAAGHDLWIEEATNSRVCVAGRRQHSDQTNRVTWTLDDARRAGLAGRPNWRNYPRQMLLARASAELARAVFADAIGGLAATEELEESGDTLNVPRPDPRAEAEGTVTSRRRTRLAPAATVSAAPPEPPPAPEQPLLPGEEPAADAPVTDAQLRKLFAMFRERGIHDRAERLHFAAATVGRPIETSRDLTTFEATKVIDALETVPVRDPAQGFVQDAQELLDAQEIPFGDDRPKDE